MRQRRWPEDIKDNALEIVYHRRKADNVVDALSKRSRVSLNAILSIACEFYCEMRILISEICSQREVRQ